MTWFDPFADSYAQAGMGGPGDETELNRLNNLDYFGGTVPKSSRLGRALYGIGRWGFDRGTEAAGAGRSAIEYSLGGPERVRSYLLDPTVPAPAPTMAPPTSPPELPRPEPPSAGAPPAGWAIEQKGAEENIFPFRTPESKAAAEAPPPPTPGEGPIEDIRQRLGFSWGGGAGPLGENGRPMTDSTHYVDPQTGRPLTDPTLYVSGKAVQAHESTGGEVEGADGITRAPGFSQTSLDKIPFSQWPDSAKQDLVQSYELRKRSAEAEDPTGLRVYREKKAIDVGGDIEKQNQMLATIRGQLQDIDDQASRATQVIMSSHLPDAVKQQKLSEITSRAENAKREYQQSVGFATGKVPSSLYAANPLGYPG